MIIEVNVSNKIARLADKNTVAVCENSDYVIHFNFDEEWAAYETKTARFKWGGKYTDVVFTGNECAMPVINNVYSVKIGVYAGNLHTTTSALLMMKKSILCGNEPESPASQEVRNKFLDVLDKRTGNLADLQTDAKDTLVAAINEAAASGGADWTQNNSEAKDYIKNRPEYLIDAPTFTCRLRVAEASEEHYGIYSSESENLSYDVKLWIAGVCYYASDDDKEKLWVKIDGHLFEMNIYYKRDHYNISYMKNGEEIFVQSWLYYGFLDDGIASINFKNFFDSVGIKEIKDPDFSFYTVKPCPIPSKMFSGYTDFPNYNVEHLVYLNFGEFPNILDKVQIANETFYDVPCISKGESVAKYTAGSYTIAIERYKDSPDSFRWSYSVKINPDVDDVIFYSKIGTKWATEGGTFEINAHIGSLNPDGSFPVTFDKTISEINSAVKDGRTPIVIVDRMLRMPLTFMDRGAYVFGTITSAQANAEYWVIIISNEPVGGRFVLATDADLNEVNKKVESSTILQSTTPGSTKKFKITVDDSGTLTATEVTE